MTSQIPVRMGSTQIFSPPHAYARGNIVLYHLFTELHICHTKRHLIKYIVFFFFWLLLSSNVHGHDQSLHLE